MGLVMFRGGPIDGRVYEIETIMSKDGGAAIPILLYRWTSETVTSARTGMKAQVWMFSGPGADNGPAPQPVASAPSNGAGATSPVAAPAPAAPASVQVDAATPAVVTLTPSMAEPAAAPPAADATAPTGDTGDQSGPGLLARRTALKLSRKQVSDDTGLAQSKIGGIEHGNAKRVKPEEIARYAVYLAGLESR